MTASTGIILYGPPAAGKSRITSELTVQDDKFQLFRKLKVGRGRRHEYRMVTTAELAAVRAQEEIIWENELYGAVYAIDRPELIRMVADEIVPVVHLGQTAAVDALFAGAPVDWLVISLECPRPLAVTRIRERDTGDTEARLAAWDQSVPLTVPTLTIDTSRCSPTEAAMFIRGAHNVPPRCPLRGIATNR